MDWLKKLLGIHKEKKLGLHAYTDADGFVHWNIVEEGRKSIWHPVKKEWLQREPGMDL